MVVLEGLKIVADINHLLYYLVLCIELVYETWNFYEIANSYVCNDMCPPD